MAVWIWMLCYNPIFYLFALVIAWFRLQLTIHSQPAITCSKLTIETQEQGVEYIQSYTPCSSISSVTLKQVKCQLGLKSGSLETFISSSFSYHASNLPLLAQGVMRLLAIHQFIRDPIWFKIASVEQFCYERLKHMESALHIWEGRHTGGWVVIRCAPWKH